MDSDYGDSRNTKTGKAEDYGRLQASVSFDGRNHVIGNGDR